MPSAYTASQKAAIAQFVGFTSAKDSVAAKHLKAHGWNTEQAIDAFFNSNNGSTNTNLTATLNKLFDKYRDNVAAEPDKIGANGAEKYFVEIGVELAGVTCLAVFAELGAPTMGELTRDGFITGWTNNHAETIAKQKAIIPQFRKNLTQNPDFFRRVYRHTFLIARSSGQKFLVLEDAVTYWSLLFTAPSVSWNTPTTPFLEWFIEYLETKWKKSVSKDMWDQTGVFAKKCLEDEEMGWWSEDGAWPGVLDEFVRFVREKRSVGAAPGEGSEMDVG